MPPRFFLILFSCFALSLLTIGWLSILGEEIDSSAEVVLGGKIKELAFSLHGMANSVFDAMEIAGKEIDEVLGEWGYSINSAISVVLIILLLSVFIGIERRIYSRTGKFYSEFLSIESGGVDIDVTKDEFRKLSSYRPLSWIFGSYSKANNLLKDARMNLNDLLLVMDRLSYLRVQITEFRASGADVTNLETILMELETELLNIAGKPMDFSSLEKIQQTWAKRDAERRELGKETGGFGWSSGNYTSLFGSPKNSLFSIGVIVLTFASLFLFIATFAEVCIETETQHQSFVGKSLLNFSSAACFGDTDSYRNFFYGSSNWLTVLVAGLSLSILNAIFITMLYVGPKALGEVNEWINEIAGKPVKHSVNAGLFSGVFCLLMAVVMLDLGGWVFNIFGFVLLMTLFEKGMTFDVGVPSTPKTMTNFGRIFYLKKGTKQYIKNETTIELALLFRFFLQLVIGLMFISWGIAGYTRVETNSERFFFWPAWSFFGLWVLWGAFVLGIVLVQRIGRDEAVYSLYKQNFKKTKDSPNKMWSQFSALCFLAFFIYIFHHYMHSLVSPSRYFYYSLGFIQCIIVMGLVFAESPIKYKYENTAQIKPNKASSVSVLTWIMWLAGFLMFILFLVFMNAEVDSHGEDEAANIFCISFVLFFIVGIAKLLDILKGHDAKHSIVDVPDWSTLKKETKAESDPIPSVVATPIFKFEEHTDKSIKEIEEEQKALVSEMEDKS